MTGQILPAPAAWSFQLDRFSAGCHTPRTEPRRGMDARSVFLGDSVAIPVPVEPDPGVFTYQVYISPYPGWWRRWRGRVITRDEEGVNDIWEWQSARGRERLLEQLWADVHSDIAWRRGGAAVELLEVTFKPG